MNTKLIYINRLIEYWKRYEIWILRIFVILFIFASIYYIPKFNDVNNSKIIGIDELYNNPNNEPADINLFIGEEEDQKFLDEILLKIFGSEKVKLSEEQKAIEIMRYIASMKNQNNTGSATKILKDGYAMCSGKSYAFRILLRKMNISTRYVSYFHTPGQGGHNITGVYYDNQWYMFDPTFGIFVYSNPKYDGRGHILSTDEIRDNSQAGYLMQVIQEPWLGDYSDKSKEFGVQPINKSYMKSYNYDIEGFEHYWRNELSLAFPVAYGATSWISMPVDIDLNNSDNYKIGEKNNKSTVMAQFNTDNRGSEYLGKTRDVPGMYHTWNIQSDGPKDIMVRYNFTEQAGDLNIIRLRSIQHLKTEKFKDHVDIHLRILSNPAIFIIINSKNSLLIDSIEVIKK